MKISELSPNVVWKQFEEILKVPRPSKHEEKMVEFLVNFANEHNLKYTVDETQNVIIKKSATKGYENKPSVALQAHMDMVCDKTADKIHDFLTDPITPIVDGEWVKADRTTLGADDGIGVAAMLAILASDDIEHGPIECLFTRDEETGLTGAHGLGKGLLNSKILLNLDSEDDGLIFIGCAGGMDTVGTMKVSYKKPVGIGSYKAYKLVLTGLLGGHSGDDINKGRGNANKLLVRFIADYAQKNTIQLADFSGGNLRNAIAHDATAIVRIKTRDVSNFEKMVKDYDAIYKNELSLTDAGVSLICCDTYMPEKVLSGKDFNRFNNLIYGMPHGVLGMSFKLKGIVETSTNLASIKFIDDKIEVVTSQRSDSESLKFFAANMVAHCFELVGAEYEHSDGYPGWTPNPDSPILKTAAQVYKDLFNQEPICCSIHAGLECGLFLEKYPDMDMISYGPTLRGVHTPDEKIEISTVDKFWKMTLEILKRV